MNRVNTQKMRLRRDPNEDDFIETSEAMVKHFSADPNYDQVYVLVSGIKVCAEGCVEKMQQLEDRKPFDRM